MREIVLDYYPRKQFKMFHGSEKRWNIIVAHRRAGKTVATIRHLERAALTSNRENPRYAYIAPLYKQAKDVAWQYLKDGAAPLVQFGAKINESELRVDYPNGGRVRLYGADRPDSLRGIYLDGVILDEAADMRPEIWSSVLRPALADREGWAVFIGTPKGRDSFYERWREAQANPQDWFALELRASRTGILPETELAAARAAMSEAEYNREFECSFDEPDVAQFIAYSTCMASQEREAIRKTPLVIGVDPARFGDDRTCLLVRAGDEIIDIKRYRGLDGPDVVGQVALMADTYKPDKIFVDGAGLGGPICDYLRKLAWPVLEVQAGAKSFQPERYGNKRVEMWATMREWIVNHGVLPDDRELIDDLVAPTYHFDAGHRMFLEKKEDMKKRGLPSPDSGDALALTFAFPVADAGLHGNAHYANRAIKVLTKASQKQPTRQRRPWL